MCFYVVIICRMCVCNIHFDVFSVVLKVSGFFCLCDKEKKVALKELNVETIP